MGSLCCPIAGNGLVTGVAVQGDLEPVAETATRRLTAARAAKFRLLLLFSQASGKLASGPWALRLW